MARRLGENIQREWDAEIFAGDLWDALEAKKSDPATGLAMLTDFASRGSALAMMYLGHAYVSDSDEANVALGEEWLKRSAYAGSVEGRFQLAAHYRRKERWADAEAELLVLVAQRYSPAMYALAHSLFEGRAGQKSTPESIRYLKLAEAEGHIPALGLLS